MAVGFFGKLLFKKGASKVSPTITKVKPNVPKTKIQKKLRDLKIATQKSKTAKVKLDNTRFRIEQQKKRLEKGRVYSGKELEQQKYFNDMNKKREKKMGFNEYKKSLREKKMGGGMMGRRFGMKKGSKFPDLTGDGKVTFADILKGRGVINGKKKSGKRMQAKDGTDPKISIDTIKKLGEKIKRDSEIYKKDPFSKFKRKRGILETVEAPPPKRTLGKPLKEKP